MWDTRGWCLGLIEAARDLSRAVTISASLGGCDGLGIRLFVWCFPHHRFLMRFGGCWSYLDG